MSDKKNTEFEKSLAADVVIPDSHFGHPIDGELTVDDAGITLSAAIPGIPMKRCGEEDSTDDIATTDVIDDNVGHRRNFTLSDDIVKRLGYFRDTVPEGTELAWLLKEAAIKIETLRANSAAEILRLTRQRNERSDEIHKLRLGIKQAIRDITGRHDDDDEPWDESRHLAEQIVEHAYSGRSQYDDAICRIEWLVQLVIAWADAWDAADRGEERDDGVGVYNYAERQEVALRKAVGR